MMMMMMVEVGIFSSSFSSSSSSSPQLIYQTSSFCSEKYTALLAGSIGRSVGRKDNFIPNKHTYVLKTYIPRKKAEEPPKKTTRLDTR